MTSDVAPVGTVLTEEIARAARARRVDAWLAAVALPDVGSCRAAVARYQDGVYYADILDSSGERGYRLAPTPPWWIPLTDHDTLDLRHYVDTGTRS